MNFETPQSKLLVVIGNEERFNQVKKLAETSSISDALKRHNVNVVGNQSGGSSSVSLYDVNMKAICSFSENDLQNSDAFLSKLEQGATVCIKPEAKEAVQAGGADAYKSKYMKYKTKYNTIKHNAITSYTQL
jgi:hypothetical protein